MRLRFVLGFVLALLLVQGQSQSVGRQYVVALPGEGSNPFVAVVVAQGKAMAYICDGQRIAEWFRGSLQAGGLFELRSTSQKARITAQVLAHSVVGAITLEDGQVLPFRALPEDSADAGLYRSETVLENTRHVGGWVVLANGEQRGAVIGGGSTRPGFRLELLSEVRANVPGLGVLKAFKITPAFVANGSRGLSSGARF